MDGCEYFCEFKAVPFKQKLLKLALCNKQTPLKSKGNNGFCKVNILPLNFS